MIDASMRVEVEKILFDEKGVARGAEALAWEVVA